MEVVGQSIRMSDMRDGYVALVKFVAERGDRVAPRGKMTREIRNATIILSNPLDALPVGVGRNLVSGIAAVESAQLLAGESRPDLLMRIGPQFGNYVEPDGEFHGAYGVRTHGQFAECVKRLTADPLSRQAIALIWNAERDLPQSLPEGTLPKKDYPCTLLYDFLLRDGKLHMTVVMRSNDVILGLGYDVFQHSRVQIAMASVLGAGLGDYIHHAVSLHLYESDLDKTDGLHAAASAPKFYPAITGSTWADVQNNAAMVLDLAAKGDDSEIVTNSECAASMQWYISSMVKAIDKNESHD